MHLSPSAAESAFRHALILLSPFLSIHSNLTFLTSIILSIEIGEPKVFHEDKSRINW